MRSYFVNPDNEFGHDRLLKATGNGAPDSETALQRPSKWSDGGRSDNQSETSAERGARVFRRLAKPRPAKPIKIIAQVTGSGTAPPMLV